MKAVSGTQMHELDQKTIQEGGIPGTRLMRIAGALAAGGIMEYRAALLPLFREENRHAYA